MRFLDMAFSGVGKRLLVMVAALSVAAAVPEVYSSATAVAQTSSKNAKKKSSAKKNTSAKTSNNKAKNSKGGTVGKSSKNAASSGQNPAKSTRRQSKGAQKNVNSGPKSSEEARRMQEAAQKEIQQTKEKIRLNEQEIKTGLADLNRLSSDIAAGRSKVEGLQKKVASLNSEISTLGNEITKNESDLKLMREEYLKAVKKMRLTNKNQSTLAFIFASENFNQAMRRLRYMRQFSAWKEKKSADIDDKIIQLEGERKRLSDVKEAQSVTLSQLNKSQAELETKHLQQERLVAGLRQNGDALQSHLVAKQNEANRLKETISSLIAQEQAKAEAERKAREKAEADRIAKEKAEAERLAREKAEAEKAALAKEAESKAGQKKKTEKDKKKKEDVSSKKKNSEKGSRSRRNRNEGKDSKEPKPVKTTNPEAAETPKTVEKSPVQSHSGKEFASMRGSLPRPVDGKWRITNQFGRHSMPELPEVEYDNPGIDAEVTKGAAVKAVCGGKVSGVYKVAGYGTVVIVNHGEYYTVYGNLSSSSVSVGMQVGSGHALGSAGSDPDDPSRGSVHFEVWKGREKQNPTGWIR